MADPSLVPLRKTRPSPTSQTIFREQAGHELVFAIVGHVGSGVTHTAKILETALEDTSLPGRRFDVTLLKARDQITEWATRTGRPTPTTGPRDMATVTALQDLGDEMRGAGDHAAVAKAMIAKIRAVRAQKQGATELDRVELDLGLTVADRRQPKSPALEPLVQEQNPDWDVADQLARLVKIITHSAIVRPQPEETAMHVAYGAQVRSACLSRQVGASIVDEQGVLVSTGTNEVPRAGGGVYGAQLNDDNDDEDHRCAYRGLEDVPFCANTREQNAIADELIAALVAKGLVADTNRQAVFDELRRSRIGSLLEFSRAVHAEMDALLNAARSGQSTRGTRMFVTTFPCHYCARHIIAAGVEEVQYIEPYPKSQALKLHDDSIGVDVASWEPPSQGGTQVLFRPFRGVAPRMYARAFLKGRDLKNDTTGVMTMGDPDWGSSFDLTRVGYAEMEALLSRDGADHG